MSCKIDLLRKICKEKNVKLTHQRLEIYREMLDSCDHPSAEDIYKRVKKRIPTISLDTVYRTLTAFYSWGLISKLYMFNDKTRFDPNIKPHHHMICTSCKKLWDFYWSEFEDEKFPEVIREWGRVDGKFVEIRGVCNNCLALAGNGAE